MNEEYGPVDLTGLKPDKLPRLIDIPGVKELAEAAYREGYKIGFRNGNPSIPEYENAYRTKYFYEYMNALEAK